VDFTLPPLPYAKEALEPLMGRETLEFHYEKHHRGYLTKLQAAIGDKPEGQKSLEEIICSSEGGVFNNAAQVWNHTFFWESMQPKGGGKPAGEIAKAIDGAFGSFDSFRKSFIDTGAGRFGSGYVWLVSSGGQLSCVDTLNAGCPLTDGHTPLLTCDVWEHAYYLDHRNDRAKFLETFVDKLVNWDRVEQRLLDSRKG